MGCYSLHLGPLRSLRRNTVFSEARGVRLILTIEDEGTYEEESPQRKGQMKVLTGNACSKLSPCNPTRSTVQLDELVGMLGLPRVSCTRRTERYISDEEADQTFSWVMKGLNLMLCLSHASAQSRTIIFLNFLAPNCKKIILKSKRKGVNHVKISFHFPLCNQTEENGNILNFL